MEDKVIDIEELAQDAHNFNKGNEQGQQLMERSFKELGAGRSILLDRNGNIIAGNKSQQAAIAAGIKKVRVIETTGDELVAVKRTDVDIDSAEGRKMAYLDNLTTQVNLTWDVRAHFTQGGGLRRGCGVDIKDKHGNRIQVGDAVRTKYGRICRVQFRQTPCFIGYDLTPIEAEHDAPDEFDLWNPCNLEIVNDTTLPETMPESFITMTEQEFMERMKQSKSKVKDGLSTSIIDMLPEDRELAATRFVGVDVGGGDDQSPELRWIPGYLIRHKADKNRMAIVEGDYAYLHGGRGVDSLSIGELDSEGKVKSIWAWAHRDEWELLDTEHVKENILKLIEYKDKVNSI